MTDMTAGDVPGAPAHELARSPAAGRVGALAAAAGLGMAHFEHRHHLPLPEDWTPPGRPELGDPPAWSSGSLPESKYQSFRHDLLLGSFHPGHRAKWTGHELLHGLVGFAWRPGASRLFLALAARLAEVLPVALWYFFDEVDLRRCPAHAGQGPLFGAWCGACEDAARRGPDPRPAERERWLAEGRAFVDRELASALRSRRDGRPRSSPYATLDLMSDGLAYAEAHAARLGSPGFEELVARFFPPSTGHHADLEALEARVLELVDAVTGATPVAAVTPLRGGRWRFVAQDLGARLLQIRADTDGDCALELDRAIAQLAARPDEAGVAATIDAYRALHDDWELPPPEAVFAVGYPLPLGLGSDLEQLERGLESACPNALAPFAPDQLRAVVADFAAADLAAPRRAPIGRRLVAFLEGHRLEGIGDADMRRRAAAIARVEAALVHAAPRDAAEATLGWDSPERSARLATGLEIVHAPAGVVDDAATDLAILRDPDGAVGAHALSPEVAAILRGWGDGARALAAVALPGAEIAALCDAGVLIPSRWRAE